MLQRRGRGVSEGAGRETEVRRRGRLRLSVQSVLALRDGDRLVEHGVLEDVPLREDNFYSLETFRDE